MGRVASSGRWLEARCADRTAWDAALRADRVHDRQTLDATFMGGEGTPAPRWNGTMNAARVFRDGAPSASVRSRGTPPTFSNLRVDRTKEFVRVENVVQPVGGRSTETECR